MVIFMEIQRKKVQAVSKVFYITLVIVTAISAVFATVQAFAFVWSLLGLPGEEVMLNDVLVTLPDFLRIGDTNLFYRIGVFEMGGVGLRPVVRTMSALIAMFMALCIFKHLKNGRTPFSQAVIQWFKRFAYALVLFNLLNAVNVMTVVITGLIPLAIIYVLDYGRMLQEESDTTL
jgi:hypothetical protein